MYRVYRLYDIIESVDSTMYKARTLRRYIIRMLITHYKYICELSFDKFHKSYHHWSLQMYTSSYLHKVWHYKHCLDFDTFVWFLIFQTVHIYGHSNCSYMLWHSDFPPSI